MEILDSVACGDGYTAAATIEDVWNSNGGYFVVTGNDVFMELQYGSLGQTYYTDEVHVPVGNGILAKGTLGIKFRNYKAGSIATISVGISEGPEPTIILTAGGQASVSGTLTAPITIPATINPDTGLIPALLVSRYILHDNLAGDFSGDGVDNFSTIKAVATGAQSPVMGVQPVAVYGLAQNSGSETPAGGNFISPDACGIYGVGTINNGGTGTAIGGFFFGRREASAPSAAPITAIQTTAVNDGAATSYLPTAVADTLIFAGNNGTTKIASALLIGGGNPIDVGVGFMGGAQSAVISASIRDDSDSVTSYIMNGVHSGYGIDFNGGTFTSGIMRLPNNQVVIGRNHSSTLDLTMFYIDTSDHFHIALSVQLDDTRDILLGTASGTRLGTTASQKLGFWGATAVVQQTATGNTTTPVAGSVTNVFTNTTFSGGVGTIGYTIGDIVACLKTVGIIQS